MNLSPREIKLLLGCTDVSSDDIQERFIGGDDPPKLIEIQALRARLHEEYRRLTTPPEPPKYAPPWIKKNEP